MSRKGYIYLIENDINNEIYIGSTTQNVEEKFQEHLNGSKNPTCYFHNYIKQIGKSHFKVKILKTVAFTDIFELFEAEAELIKNIGTLNNKELKETSPVILSSESHNNIQISKQICLDKANKIPEFLSFEDFTRLFLDDKTLAVIDYFNENKLIRINSAFLNWLGYESESNKSVFKNMLLKNKIPFFYDTIKNQNGKTVEIFKDNIKERKVLSINSEYIIEIMFNSPKASIRSYFTILSKLVKYYTEYFTEHTKKKKPSIVKFKGSYTPERAHKFDAGLDLKTIVDFSLNPMERKLIDTGISTEIPENYVGYIMSKSGLSHNCGVIVLNSPGVVDTGYSGNIFVNLINLGSIPVNFTKGMKIAQLVIQKIHIPDLNMYNSESPRGSKGFGSTGI